MAGRSIFGWGWVVCVCVWESIWERERMCVYVCVCVYAWVCEYSRERQRYRKRVCVCVCLSMWVYLRERERERETSYYNLRHANVWNYPKDETCKMKNVIFCEKKLKIWQKRSIFLWSHSPRHESADNLDYSFVDSKNVYLKTGTRGWWLKEKSQNENFEKNWVVFKRNKSYLYLYNNLAYFLTCLFSRLMSKLLLSKLWATLNTRSIGPC